MQNYGGDEKLTLDDFMLYDYSLLTPEQKEQQKIDEYQAKARQQAAALKGFFASKVNKQTITNNL